MSEKLEKTAKSYELIADELSKAEVILKTESIVHAENSTP